MPIFDLTLNKGPDEETYKKFANEGMNLMHPVTINGKSHRRDIDIPYHTSVKLFDPAKDKAHDIHHKASHMSFETPNPEHVHIEPAMLTGKTGYQMHVLKLHGSDAERIKSHNDSFKGHGYEQNYKFHPHITVDKQTWDHIKNSGAKTAKEAGIQFHAPELRHGKRILHTYGAKDIKKGAIHNAVAGLALMGAASMPSNQAVHATTQNEAGQRNPYSHSKMLNAIAQVESQNGKFQQHKAVGGMHHGDRAYGKFALMPNTIRETIGLNPDLKSKYGKAMALRGQDMHNFMQDNKGLEDTIADAHLKRLEHHFGPHPDKIGYAWLEGVTGANKAIKNKQDISTHWHAKKVSDAYKGQK